MSGPNPLDLQSIITYNKEVSKEPMEFFIDLMQELDAAYLEAEAKKQKKKTKSKESKGRR